MTSAKQPGPQPDSSSEAGPSDNAPATGAIGVTRRSAIAFGAAAVVAAGEALAQGRPPGGGQGGPPRGPQAAPPPAAAPAQPRGAHGNAGDFLTDVPDHPLDVVAGRPTDRSICLSLLAYAGRRVRVACRAASGAARDVGEIDLAAGAPREVVIADLAPGLGHSYEVRAADGGEVLFAGEFQTARPAGAPFTFTITADSHLDRGTRLDIYERTLRNVVADKPDLHFDLGDTFMTESYDDYREAGRQYLAQRHWFGLVSRRAPVFLLLGNHDGEFGSVRQRDRQEMPLFAAKLRTSHFPNPLPDRFYSGNATPVPGLGLPQNYYAFRWGDAEFIVLDSYWPTVERGGRGSLWDTTIGAEQYRWLTRTLETSTASLRFVFTHHLTGGGGRDHRGGVEVAPFYEWGGREEDGAETFAANRPGWAMPIHQLLVKHRVNAVFRGHDHFYGRQELDGIAYQVVPQPSRAEGGRLTQPGEYGYRRGEFLPSPGHLRVSVEAGKARVDYVRAFLPEEAARGRTNGRIDASYELAARA
ncbi:MAG: metallophosphoesterase [Bauldia sp.]